MPKILKQLSSSFHASFMQFVETSKLARFPPKLKISFPYKILFVSRHYHCTLCAISSDTLKTQSRASVGWIPVISNNNLNCLNRNTTSYDKTPAHPIPRYYHFVIHSSLSHPRNFLVKKNKKNQTKPVLSASKKPPGNFITPNDRYRQFVIRTLRLVVLEILEITRVQEMTYPKKLKQCVVDSVQFTKGNPGANWKPPVSSVIPSKTGRFTPKYRRTRFRVPVFPRATASRAPLDRLIKSD